MDPQQKQMTELVAELRERLRLFAGRSFQGPPGQRDPGPLDLGERLALTSRMLAEGLVMQGGQGADQLANELRELAGAVESIPAPLAGSEVAAGLEDLVQVMDDLACAWDRRRQTDLSELWRRVRAAGDRVWEPRSAPEADQSDSARSETDHQVWLLVNGALRRSTLCHRLREAGYAAVALDDIAVVMARLESEHPAAVICDDAAPGRFHHRLRAHWSDRSTPLVLVRAGRTTASGVGPAWLPPYRPGDLQALLS